MMFTIQELDALNDAYRPRDSKGKPSSLSKEDRAALDPYWKQMRDKLSAADNDELDAILRASLNVSQTNCGWQIYRFADLLFWPARNLLAQRIEAGTAETSARPEGREPVPEGVRPKEPSQ